MNQAKDILNKLGYETFKLPKHMSYDTLSYFVNKIKVPLLLDLELGEHAYGHAIGILPIDDTLIIIEGSTSLMTPIEFSKKNVDYVCGGNFQPLAKNHLLLCRVEN